MVPVRFQVPLDEAPQVEALDPYLRKLERIFRSSDPLWRKHAENAWRAVCYRYRFCVECNDEFKRLIQKRAAQLADDASPRSRGADMYELERCIFSFFVSSVSIFDSLGFCLYFVGAIIRSSSFPLTLHPRKINLSETAKALSAAFPKQTITNLLSKLSKDKRFTELKAIRDILTHRLTGGSFVQMAFDPRTGEGKTLGPRWQLAGIERHFDLNEDHLQVHLNGLTDLLTCLMAASIVFVDTPYKGAFEGARGLNREQRERQKAEEIERQERAVAQARREAEQSVAAAREKTAKPTISESS